MTPANILTAAQVGQQLYTLYLEHRTQKPRAEISAEEEAEQLAEISAEISTTEGKAAFLALAEAIREKAAGKPDDDVDGEPI